MLSNRFLPHPNAIQAMMSGTLNLATDALYAALMEPTLVPTLAMTTYGAFAQVSTAAITGATAANPVVITSVGHGLTSGDYVFITGVVGMTQLNGNTYKITVIDANTFSLQNYAGANIDGTAFTAYTSGGTWYKTYECTAQTGYARVALTTQSIITSGQRRAFTCANISFGTTVSLTSKLYAIFKGTAAAPTAADILVGWELLNPISGLITGVTAANPGVVTSAGHGLANADSILIQGVDMIDIDTLNRSIQTAASVTTNTFALSGLDLSASPQAGREGAWTKLNSTQAAQSVNAQFSITIPGNGLFAI